MEGEELIRKFESYLRTAGRSPDTLRSYPATIRQFSVFMKGNLLEVTKDDLKAYLDTMRARQFKQSSVQRHFTILYAFYECLIDDELYKSANPITPSFRRRYIRTYKAVSGERYCPSTEEVVKLVNSIISTRDLAIVVTLFKCGLRRKELCELSVSNVNMDKMTIILNPTKKRTNLRVFFDDECAYVLQRWLKRRETLNVNNSQALFLTKDATRMSSGAVGEMFRKYAKAAGFTSDRIEEKLTPHCARHWFTTELIKAGMRAENVTFLRGDIGQSVAARTYYHTDLEQVKEEYLRCIPRLGLI